jgi:t-SNARE complex subunit (syntaxin)
MQYALQWTSKHISQQWLHNNRETILYGVHTEELSWRQLMLQESVEGSPVELKFDSLNTEIRLIKDAVKETSDSRLRRLGEWDELVQSQLQRGKDDFNKQIERINL